MPSSIPQIPDERLTELLGLLDASDTVELKVTVPEASIRATAMALEMDALGGQIREVGFFDTPDLRLSDAGVVVRARRVQGRAGDAVVKLRPVIPGALDPALRAMPGFGVEVDAMPGGFVCSGRLKAEADNDLVRETFTGRRPLRKLLTKAQRELYRAHAPAGLELDDLVLLGPVFALKLKLVPAGMPRKMVAELWMYPDGTRIFELSMRCQPGEAFDQAVRARAFLTSRGVDLSGEQAAKTRRALEYFSGPAAG